MMGQEQLHAFINQYVSMWHEADMFRPVGNTDAHHHLVKFRWEMLPKAGGPIEARGLDILVLREDGRIRALYQFSEPLA